MEKIWEMNFWKNKQKRKKKKNCNAKLKKETEKEKGEKKLEKQAEAAQLAAAQAAGFPFALLPSNMPPPHIPGMPETPHEKKKIHLHHLRRRSKILPRKIHLQK